MIMSATVVVIGLGLVVKVAFAVEEEVLTGEWTEAMIGGATDIGASSGLTAVIVSLEFALRS